MSSSFNDLIIPTFPGINDQPVNPTASRAGNGAHLIKSYNDLINKLSVASSSNWKVIQNSYEASAGDRLIVPYYSEPLIIINFPLEPIPGESITVLSSNAGNPIYLGNITKYLDLDVREVKLSIRFEAIEVIYVDTYTGWIPSRDNIIEIKLTSEVDSE